MAKMAVEHMELDRIVFQLCAMPAHKELDFNVSARDRIKMLKVTADIDKRYFIDDSEAKMILLHTHIRHCREYEKLRTRVQSCILSSVQTVLCIR